MNCLLMANVCNVTFPAGGTKVAALGRGLNLNALLGGGPPMGGPRPIAKSQPEPEKVTS